MTTLQDRPPPSTAAIAFATAILCGLGGYFLGQASSLGIFRTARSSISTRAAATAAKSSSKARPSSRLQRLSSEVEDSSSEEIEDLLEEGEEFGEFQGNDEECKLVLVVRTDLGMNKGKIAAQCSHATLACYKTLLQASPSLANPHPVLRKWERHGQAKVTVQVNSSEQLEMLQAQAISLGLCAKIIHDAGRTQIAAGSATVLGLGPGPKSVVDQVTGGLKLL